MHNDSAEDVSVRLKRSTRSKLHDLKRGQESLDDVVNRLIAEHEETIDG